MIENFHSIETRKISPGGLTERKQLRDRLKCENFKWYLENIYPETPMIYDYIAIGAVSKPNSIDIPSLISANSYIAIFIDIPVDKECAQSKMFGYIHATIHWDVYMS